MILPDKWYNLAKWFVQIVLPAIGAAYFALSDLWDLPNVEQVVGTCAILAVFLGAVLGISSRNYYNSDVPYDGNVVVTNPEGAPKNFSLELNKDPEELESQTSIRMKVVSEPTEPPVEESV